MKFFQAYKDFKEENSPYFNKMGFVTQSHEKTPENKLETCLWLLGLPVNRAYPFTRDEVNKAFKDRAFELHPDKNSHLSDKLIKEKTDKLKHVNNAKEYLLDRLDNPGYYTHLETLPPREKKWAAIKFFLKLYLHFIYGLSRRFYRNQFALMFYFLKATPARKTLIRKAARLASNILTSLSFIMPALIFIGLAPIILTLAIFALLLGIISFPILSPQYQTVRFRCTQYLSKLTLGDRISLSVKHYSIFLGGLLALFIWGPVFSFFSAFFIATLPITLPLSFILKKGGEYIQDPRCPIELTGEKLVKRTFWIRCLEISIILSKVLIHIMEFPMLLLKQALLLVLSTPITVSNLILATFDTLYSLGALIFTPYAEHALSTNLKTFSKNLLELLAIPFRLLAGPILAIVYPNAHLSKKDVLSEVKSSINKNAHEIFSHMPSNHKMEATPQYKTKVRTECSSDDGSHADDLSADEESFNNNTKL